MNISIWDVSKINNKKMYWCRICLQIPTPCYKSSDKMKYLQALDHLAGDVASIPAHCDPPHDVRQYADQSYRQIWNIHFDSNDPLIRFSLYLQRLDAWWSSSSCSFWICPASGCTGRRCCRLLSLWTAAIILWIVRPEKRKFIKKKSPIAGGLQSINLSKGLVSVDW